MVSVAEFAALLNEKNPTKNTRLLTPAVYPSVCETVYDIRAIICDIYGCLINYWHYAFTQSDQRIEYLRAAFSDTITFFKLEHYLREMNPNEPPENTLYELYHGLVLLNHEKNQKKGIRFPEVRVEEVWEVILLLLQRRGYDPSSLGLGTGKEFAKCIAYYYNFKSLNGCFYEGVVDTLKRFHQSNFKLGILSNAQFYTPLDLSLQLRQITGNSIIDYSELFDTDLTLFSFEQGVVKPDSTLLERLSSVLYNLDIMPSQTIVIGNDLIQDIKPAQDFGMKTALFCGDRCSLFLHDLDQKVIPDICFSHWSELTDKIVFFQEKQV